MLKRNLTYYWCTNLAVVLGVATAVAVLAGALLVGESVRGSLRDLFLGRLGKTDSVVISTGFFREALAADLGGASCPLVALEGFVTHQQSGRRASQVQVYGVDDRFWKFHGRADRPLTDRQILLGESLARELEAKPGDGILIRLEKPSAIPAESLHGRKEDLGSTIRYTMNAALTPAELGEFSLRPQQGTVRAVFVSLRRLQKELEQVGKANTILVAGVPQAEIETNLRDKFALADLGVKIRPLEERGCFSVESESLLLPDPLAESVRTTARRLGMRSSGIFAYLANTIRAGDREIPYSLVAAIEESAPAKSGEPPPPTIVLNEWAAKDLNAKSGDIITLEYYLWNPEGRLVSGSTKLMLRGVVPIRGPLADRDLTPEYPGITTAKTLHDWNPPFPVDLKRIRPRDEQYWDEYRTTPKAFILLEQGQELWQSRFGKLTSIRVYPPNPAEFAAAMESYQRNLRAALDPVRTGLSVYPARAQGIEASRGATDFGEYFVYFSFFLVVSALLLAALFFRLGVEQRLREIGLLRAVGFSPSRIRNQFLAEGLALAVAGSVLGIAGAWGYGALLLYGLRTWWVGAVGTTSLYLHVSAAPLVAGAAGGIAVALLCIAWTLRGLLPVSPRTLLLGGLPPGPVGEGRRALRVGIGLGAAGVLLLAASALGQISQVGGFFGAGGLLLAALLCFQWRWLSRRNAKPVAGVRQLGFRNAAHRPGRSVLSIALIASAVFLIVALNAFRRSGDEGGGGFPLLAESMLPIVYDLNSAAGRDTVNLPALRDVKFVPFRLRPGDDTSCLNLYQPRNPRILAPAADFVRSNRFAFQESLAKTPEEKENPWLLLDTVFPDGAIPAIADANSMTYSLHLKLGQDFVLNRVRLRLVGALAHSVFQGELLVSDKNFVRLFPDQEGYRFFFIDVPREKAGQITPQIEDALSDFGFDVTSTADRLAAFNRVENTYLSTFQTLGGLGLLLGTVGLAAVLLRNVLERRRELALLQAVGYRGSDLARMVFAENLYLLISGIATGAFCALLAIAPALLERGGQPANAGLAILLLAVLATGTLASLAAVRAVVRTPLIPALKAE